MALTQPWCFCNLGQNNVSALCSVALALIKKNVAKVSGSHAMMILPSSENYLNRVDLRRNKDGHGETGQWEK